MARWKLTTSHYLNCKDTEWEYKEVDQQTGRERRKVIPVPRFLDINDPNDWTNKWGNRDNQTGEIIVCQEGKGAKDDITFYGDPTPDMSPVDDEARAISATFEDHWRYKPETAEISYSQSMIDKFQVEVAELKAAPQKVEIEGLSEMVAAMTALTQQNAELMKNLVTRKL